MDPNAVTSLETLAEIAITIMGFTGLVGALQQRGRKAFSGPTSSVTITLLIVSGQVVVASFLPGTIYLRVEDPNQTWEIAFQILLGVHILGWLLATPPLRRAGWLLGIFPQPDRAIGFIMMFIGLSAVLVEILVVTGLIESYLPFIYQSILVSLLVIGMFSFVLVLFALDRDDST